MLKINGVTNMMYKHFCISSTKVDGMGFYILRVFKAANFVLMYVTGNKLYIFLLWITSRID